MDAITINQAKPNIDGLIDPIMFVLFFSIIVIFKPKRFGNFQLTPYPFQQSFGGIANGHQDLKYTISG